MGGEARGFHQSLNEVRNELVQLAALVSEGIPRATAALLDGDHRAADELVATDDDIDERAKCVEEECLRLLTLQQPMAGDLRALVTAVKLSWEIERSGDLVVNISKSVRHVRASALEPRLRGLIEGMSEQAHSLTCRAIDAYATGDVALAAALDDMDDALDALQGEFIEVIMHSHETKGLDLQVAVQLALIGRYYERIGDHAVNVGQRTQYMVSGWMPEHTGAVRAQARARNASAADLRT